MVKDYLAGSVTWKANKIIIPAWVMALRAGSVTTVVLGRPTDFGLSVLRRSCSAWTKPSKRCRKRSNQVWATSAADQGHLLKNRDSPDRLIRSPTTRNNPVKVFRSSHSINPSSMVTKYFHWRLRKQGRKASRNWHSCSVQFCWECSGWGHFHSPWRAVFINNTSVLESEQGKGMFNQT